jgi:hypothetical protein
MSLYSVSFLTEEDISVPFSVILSTYFKAVGRPSLEKSRLFVFLSFSLKTAGCLSLLFLN